MSESHIPQVTSTSTVHSLGYAPINKLIKHTIKLAESGSGLGLGLEALGLGL